MIELLLYRVRRGVEPRGIDDVFDGEVFSNMIKKYLELEGVPQAYKYSEFDTDILTVFTCDSVSVHKGLGARQLKHNTCFSCSR
jgi:hypothetical protein